ncbi:hypothetical protein BKA62DRAFT_712190 [Auriculariales sp. MPI-PUGE-AT-0066]|nr:hypothetical protein BKA62DRAFT_712190 [Auriculariales sp. MPI-PUGE-AT-0066]
MSQQLYRRTQLNPRSPLFHFALIDPDESPSEDQCRICLLGRGEDDGSLGALFSPCLCRGTGGKVHAYCLHTWLCQLQRTGRPLGCNLCRIYLTPFRLPAKRGNILYSDVLSMIMSLTIGVILIRCASIFCSLVFPEAVFASPNQLALKALPEQYHWLWNPLPQSVIDTVFSDWSSLGLMFVGTPAFVIWTNVDNLIALLWLVPIAEYFLFCIGGRQVSDAAAGSFVMAISTVGFCSFFMETLFDELQPLMASEIGKMDRGGGLFLFDRASGEAVSLLPSKGGVWVQMVNFSYLVMRAVALAVSNLYSRSLARLDFFVYVIRWAVLHLIFMWWMRTGPPHMSQCCRARP